jgi:uncharacterized membrane protein
MFPVSLSVGFVSLLEFAIIGLVVGVVLGILVSIILRLPVKKTVIAIDAFLGAIGFFIMWIGMSRSQHPFIAAVTFAGVLPALHQFFRFRRRLPGL